MQIYLVGGAVRDSLLDIPVVDHDWVVVGATPAELLALGYQQVGKDFPVFLNPDSHEEYALARTERKSGQGYTGFTCYAAPDVTLEEDLLRRDLTINAIARSAEGELIDPYGGVAICKRACCATFQTRSAKIRCACCAWPASLPASPTGFSHRRRNARADAPNGARR